METKAVQHDHTDTPLYNSRIVDTYVKLISNKYPAVNVRELLNDAGMTSYEVADPGHWFSQRQINRFHEKLRDLTQNDHIAREAGRFAACPDTAGFIRPYIMGMVGPEKVFDLVNRAAQKFTLSTHYKSRRLSANKFEITVTPKKGVQERRFQCENRMGFFESITLSFTSKLPTIQHPECIFKGNSCCRYLISWERSFVDFWKKIRVYLAVGIPIGAFFYAKFVPGVSFLTMLCIGVLIYFVLSQVGEYLENLELKKSLTHLWDSADSLLEQVNANYNKSILTNEIGRAINTKTNIEEILQNIIKILETRLDFDRGLILLADEQQERLEIRAGFGYPKQEERQIQTTFFHLDKPDSKGIFVKSYRKQKAYLINDIDEIRSRFSAKSLNFAKKMGSNSFICCPILNDRESIGILAVDNLKSKRPLVQSDLVLLKGIASVIGVSIANAQLIEAKQRQFTSLIQVLGASIDARDPMTSGHSEKVTEYAMGICDELKLSNDHTEAIRVGALLHDYGKIGVPDAVLKKPGRLTRTEKETIRTHALKTREILEKIHFEGIYSEVPEIAGAHHEKYDGTGYPKGLKGEEIHLGARIIAVADFFEAITSERHYRDPMNCLKAIELLMDHAGTHFDPRVVNAFRRYYSKAYLVDCTPKAISA